MILLQAHRSAEEVLGAFYADAPYLFLGSAFITTGLLSIGLCALRRRFNALLVWLGVFSALYGLRLWLQASIFRLDPNSHILIDRLPVAINYIMPIPAFTFFRAAGFLGSNRKSSRMLLVVMTGFICMFVTTLIVGPVSWFGTVNVIVVTVYLWIMLVRSLRNRKGDMDFKVVRAGVLCFLIFALWDNYMGTNRNYRVEPYGFAVLLGTLGYVAARRTLQRDVELSEIQKELDLARSIQMSILPGAFPESADFRVGARYVPMAAVAGDLYDFLEVGERKAGLFIADVSGHGVPAALIASMVKMAATSQRDHAAQPAQLLEGMNAALCGNTQGQLVTAAYAHLDAQKGELHYAAAGHPAALLLRNGAVTEIVENGLPLAATGSAAFSAMKTRLEPGDRLMLYTDGIVEARNGRGEMFGDERLTAALSSTATLTAQQTADHVIGAAREWGSVQEDDLTVLVCDCLLPERLHP